MDAIEDIKSGDTLYRFGSDKSEGKLFLHSYKIDKVTPKFYKTDRWGTYIHRDTLLLRGNEHKGLSPLCRYADIPPEFIKGYKVQEGLKKLSAMSRFFYDSLSKAYYKDLPLAEIEEVIEKLDKFYNGRY